MDRREIIAPVGFVSVYHDIAMSEVKTRQALNSINMFGLEPGHDEAAVNNEFLWNRLAMRKVFDDNHPWWLVDDGI